MVDVKREDITLSDWTKGISADEFAWGSYYFSNGIQTWYSTKWFKLWPYSKVESLNERTTWWPVAVCATNWSMLSDSNSLAFFTHDGMLEMSWTLNGSTQWEGWENGWGAIFKTISHEFVGWYVHGDIAIGFSNSWAYKINYKDTYSVYGQTVVDPNLETWTWWTLGTWWTLTDKWAKHTVWETGTLVTTADGYDNGRGRLAIKIVGCTAWNVSYSIGGDTFTTEVWRNGWFMDVPLNIGSWVSYTITITPSEDFNGTVAALNFNVFKPTAYSSVGITTANKHMALEWWGDIYISSWNAIDILNTSSWTITDSKTLIKTDEEIVALTQQWDALIIWATDGINSHQYYWNGVDSIATEVIEWKWQVIKWVVGTETVAYVLAWVGGIVAWYAYRLYSVSWYQRSLIASNAYKVENSQWNLEHYHPSKKFAFNDVEWPESMCIYMDNLYIPWCDGIYQFWQTLPWLGNAWSRPIDYQNWADKIFLYQDGVRLAYSYRLNQRNYYATVENGKYAYKWYLVTDSIYRDKIWTRKSLEKLKIWYKNLAADDWEINIYAIVDDDYFWRFDVTWVTNRPSIWDIYEVADETTAEVIAIEKTTSSKWTISFRTVDNGGSLTTANRYLNKISGEGDSQLDSNNNYDNMMFVKNITREKQGYNSDLIFWKDFVNNYIPYWHKIQLVVELVKKSSYRNDYRTPEIYEISMISDITDVTL